MAKDGTLNQSPLVAHRADRFSRSCGIGDSSCFGLRSARDADGTGASDAGSVA